MLQVGIAIPFFFSANCSCFFPPVTKTTIAYSYNTFFPRSLFLFTFVCAVGTNCSY